MIFTEQEQNKILETIEKYGKAELPKVDINTNINDVLTFSSGAARIQRTFIRKAVLILGIPKEIYFVAHQSIRCALCKRVISYPAWYYRVGYAVNVFHYFVCFDAASPEKPSTKCYRKDI